MMNSMTAVVARRGVERPGMWRLAAAIATRWHAQGKLRDRWFTMLRAEDPDPPIAMSDKPTKPLVPRAA